MTFERELTWRLCDASEREFLAPLNVRDEIEINAETVASWVAARGR